MGVQTNIISLLVAILRDELIIGPIMRKAMARQPIVLVRGVHFPPQEVARIERRWPPVNRLKTAQGQLHKFNSHSELRRGGILQRTAWQVEDDEDDLAQQRTALSAPE